MFKSIVVLTLMVSSASAFADSYGHSSKGHWNEFGHHNGSPTSSSNTNNNGNANVNRNKNINGNNNSNKNVSRNNNSSNSVSRNSNSNRNNSNSVSRNSNSNRSNSKATGGNARGGNSVSKGGTANGGNSSNDISYNSSYTEKRQIATVIAPSLTTGMCLGSVSGGFGNSIFGASFGKTTEDTQCSIRYNSIRLSQVGQKQAATLILCQVESMRKALELTGFDCKVKHDVKRTTKSDRWDDTDDSDDWDFDE